MNTKYTKTNCVHVGVILVQKFPEVFTDKIAKALNLNIDILVTDSIIVNLSPYHINPPTLV